MKSADTKGLWERKCIDLHGAPVQALLVKDVNIEPVKILSCFIHFFFFTETAQNIHIYILRPST